MENEFDFEEISRRCDKETFILYFDEALTYRNYILNIKKILKDENLSPESVINRIKALNEDLKLQYKKIFMKRFPHLFAEADK